LTDEPRWAVLAQRVADLLLRTKHLDLREPSPGAQ
jgi:hypothetical protein